jgi:hypothetical protein
MKKYLLVIFTIFSFTLFGCASTESGGSSFSEYGSPQLPCEETDSYAGETVTCVVTMGEYSCGQSPLGDYGDETVYCGVPDWSNTRLLVTIKGKDYHDYNGKCLVLKGFVDYTDVTNPDGTTQQMLGITAGSDVSSCQ